VTSAESALGRQFRPYCTFSLLGVGGMGEEYRAHGGKLGRAVAIKTLPSAFAQHPERLARFRREALPRLTIPTSRRSKHRGEAKAV
jgi:hypothetical protein